jgi:hypothetical protein
MEENFNEEIDVFNLQAESFVNAAPKKLLDTYEPAADKGRDGTYEAVIRFLPNHKNPSLSKVHKYRIWLQDPTEEKGFYVDCPSSVGKKSVLKDLYWKLKKSTSAREQEIADQFSRADTYYSLVQIIEDKNEPTLEGKIMVFRYGIKINTKIEALLKPTRGAVVNPFDLFDGKDFTIKITKKNKWNNFDQCAFEGDRVAITLPGESSPIQKTAEDKARTLAWLKENSPDLERYEFKEWSDEVTAKVNKAILNIVPDARTVEGLIANAANDTAVYEAPADGGTGFATTPVTKATNGHSHKHDHVSAEETAQVSVIDSKRETKAVPTTKASTVEDLYDGL